MFGISYMPQLAVPTSLLLLCSCLQYAAAPRCLLARHSAAVSFPHIFVLQAAIKKAKAEATDEEWAQVLVAVPTGATPQKLNIEYGKPGAECSDTRAVACC